MYYFLHKKEGDIGNKSSNWVCIGKRTPCFQTHLLVSNVVKRLIRGLCGKHNWTNIPLRRHPFQRELLDAEMHKALRINDAGELGILNKTRGPSLLWLGGALWQTR